jgi:hypothetical protein
MLLIKVVPYNDLIQFDFVCARSHTLHFFASVVLIVNLRTDDETEVSRKFPFIRSEGSLTMFIHLKIQTALDLTPIGGISCNQFRLILYSTRSALATLLLCSPVIK